MIEVACDCSHGDATLADLPALSAKLPTLGQTPRRMIYTGQENRLRPYSCCDIHLVLFIIILLFGLQ